MPVMGRCMICDRLVYLMPVSQRWGSKVIDYRPVEHARVTHTNCNQHLETPEIGAHWYCDLCDKNVDAEDISVDECPGHKTIIK